MQAAWCGCRFSLFNSPRRPALNLFPAPAGLLATRPGITTARKQGEEIGAGQFLRAGLCTTPLVLLAAGGLL